MVAGVMVMRNGNVPLQKTSGVILPLRAVCGDRFFGDVRVPCGSHLGRIGREDQSPFLPQIKGLALTLKAHPDSPRGPVGRIAYESTALFFGHFRTPSGRKKIKIRLTREGPRLPLREGIGTRLTSCKQLIYKHNICHGIDTPQHCTPAIPAGKSKRKSPASPPGSSLIA